MRILNSLVLVSLVALMAPISAQPIEEISLSNSTSTPINEINNDAIVSQLKPFSAHYVAYRSGNDVGSAHLQLESVENNQYELVYNSKVSRFFLSDKRFEKTRFYQHGDTLVPIHYDYKRTGTGPNKSLSVIFDQELKKIQIGKDNVMNWDGEVDNQLFRIDLPSKLANGVTDTHYDFINYRGEKRQYKLEVLATDNLSLPYGQITAIKVKIARESNSRVTFAWFAPSLSFNLVRLQQFKDDKEQGDIQLNSFAYL
jgi:hypothetical protein